MINEIEVRDFIPTESNAIPLAKTYAEVFSTAPWWEVTRCPGCKSFAGNESAVGQQCKCGAVMQEAYPVVETAVNLLEDAKRPNAVTKVLYDQDKPVGFGIGFPYSFEEFVDEKYSTDAGKRSIREAFDYIDLSGEVFYISEVGITSPYRGNGYSNLLVDAMTDRATDLGLGQLMRTRFDSPMVVQARRLGMPQVLGRLVSVADYWNKNQKRVQRIVPSDGAINATDVENPSRVMFYKPAIYRATRVPKMIPPEDRCVGYLG